MWLYGLYIVMHQWVSDCYHGRRRVRRQEEARVPKWCHFMHNHASPKIISHLHRHIRQPLGRNKTSDALNTTCRFPLSLSHAAGGTIYLFWDGKILVGDLFIHEDLLASIVLEWTVANNYTTSMGSVSQHIFPL